METRDIVLLLTVLCWIPEFAIYVNEHEIDWLVEHGLFNDVKGVVTDKGRSFVCQFQKSA